MESLAVVVLVLLTDTDLHDESYRMVWNGIANIFIFLVLKIHLNVRNWKKTLIEKYLRIQWISRISIWWNATIRCIHRCYYVCRTICSWCHCWTICSACWTLTAKMYCWRNSLLKMTRKRSKRDFQLNFLFNIKGKCNDHRREENKIKDKPVAWPEIVLALTPSYFVVSCHL